MARPRTSPQPKQAATEGMSFHNARDNIAICAPTRSIIATDRYDFNNGCFGFNKFPKDIPTVLGTFQKNSYLTGILSRVPRTDVRRKRIFSSSRETTINPIANLHRQPKERAPKQESISS